METGISGDATPGDATTARPRAARSRKAVLDPVAAAAVDLARSVAEELSADTPTREGVGAHLGVTVEGERLVSHEFECLLPGYHGWRWSVVLARAPRQKTATVVESALLPGPDALLAPEWVPWSERLRPGDLGVGDVLPTEEDDPRLAPGWTAGPTLDDEDAAELWEMGLGRARVLSLEGRTDAAERWYSGDGGPQAPIALAAPAHCATCGFLVLLGGSFRQAFGACSNVYSPSDGRVVALDHGCGAHSEAAVTPASIEPAPPVLDELGYEYVSVPAGAHPDGSVDSASPGEDLGHS
ncbi:Protein of unknown function (DUF3027) [Motilibacter peucedani]|uniref:DUF3027 family protein n=1 Tax=Motilibacter peucedani TaxID=598650 RepID=A0A420XKG8_9ACTN|nr:DUF3027 domain-containing protein [Motilibacter peucedani]RKS68523.1 Protein of unknown function (DUF3027) [Motilibacter peucedani]